LIVALDLLAAQIPMPEKYQDHPLKGRMRGFRERRIGEPHVKHIDGDLWELRPLSYRILFFHWRGNKIILLHHFIKKTKKTPAKEIDQAMRNRKDFLERNDRQ
jgi:phage-related protein